MVKGRMEVVGGNRQDVVVEKKMQTNFDASRPLHKLPLTVL